MSLKIHNNWQPASDWQPNNPRCVLAWDGDEHFVAVWEGGKWWNAHTDEQIDSFVTHWCELPEPEECPS